MIRVSVNTVFQIELSLTTPQPFYALFPGPPEWAGARRELLDFMVQGKINGGRHTDHPARHHSIHFAYLHHLPIFSKVIIYWNQLPDDRI